MGVCLCKIVYIQYLYIYIYIDTHVCVSIKNISVLPYFYGCVHLFIVCIESLVVSAESYICLYLLENVLYKFLACKKNNL